MDTLLRPFTKHLQVQGLSPNTVDAYCRDVTSFLTWLNEQAGEGPSPAGAIASDVRTYRDHLMDLGRKPATVNRRLAGLRAFFDWAVKTERAPSNPATGVSGVKQARQAPRSLDAQEVRKLQRIAAAQCQLAEAQRGEGSVTPTVVFARRDEALLNLILYTGLRLGEVASLRLDDVILNERSGQVIVRAGEGRKHREIPLHKEARKALAAYLELRADGENDRFFLGQRGPLSERGIQMRLRALGEAAGLDVTPQVLRHTLAKRLLRETGVDLLTLSKLLGHTDVSSTAIYMQPNGANLSEAMEGLE